METMSLQAQIRSSMQRRSTEELVEIWQTNDHAVWTDTAFDAIKDILLERLGSIPEQNPPVGYSTEAADPPGKILDRFEDAIELNRLLDLLWIACLLPIVSFVFVIALWIASLINHTTFTVSNGWFSALAILALPLYFWRKGSKRDLSNIRKELSELLSGGLDR